jgi:hypothetical protein
MVLRMSGEHDFIELEGCLSDGGSNVARPGDVLIIHALANLTQEQASRIRDAIKLRLPGLADVVIVPCSGTSIYRPDPS